MHAHSVTAWLTGYKDNNFVVTSCYEPTAMVGFLNSTLTLKNISSKATEEVQNPT